ncbi:helix-turn-helix transcriptional regulator [Bordetella bronchiseptica]|uniref:helix-turn-helix transcriptional regulator n=1 Tax=Bordetella bronchiseptica TaxID=518 RepID=UPI000459AC39|nr:helix-turn-helix transcriptional regulator [Bordetella bronchiseptica]KCV62272.1 transcriptional regulator, LuxR family [Bordetella bronchiseptica 99-R-0433]
MDARPAAAAAAQTEDRLLHALYGTLNDDTQWQQVLAALCRRFATRTAALAHYDFDAGAGRILYQAPADGPLQAIYDQGRPLNPWFLSKAPYLPGRILDSPELIAPEDFLQTDFYREILRPHGLFHRLCGVLARQRNHVWYLVLHRRKEQMPFDGADRARLRTLMPHLMTVFEVRARCAAQARLASLLARVVQAYLPPVLVLDRDGAVLHGEVAADALPAQLRLVDGRLAARDAALQKPLRERIHRMAEAALAGRPGRASLALDEADGAAPIQLTLCALGPDTNAQGGQAGALVGLLISDPGQDARQAMRRFADHFALSPAEEKVSALILQGMTPARVARSLHISEHTVRSHLKQIFRKTNTHRQAELMSLRERADY